MRRYGLDIAFVLCLAVATSLFLLNTYLSMKDTAHVMHELSARRDRMIQGELSA